MTSGDEASRVKKFECLNVLRKNNGSVEIKKHRCKCRPEKQKASSVLCDKNTFFTLKGNIVVDRG